MIKLVRVSTFWSLRYSVWVLFAGAITGCATQAPPAEILGPSASISDHGFPEDGFKARLFYVRAVDGQPIRSSAQASRAAGYGGGFRTNLRYLEHKVPVKPLRIALVGTHVTGAPIHEIALRASGEFLRVEGEVSFTPEADGQYFVKGELFKSGSYVCVADAKTEQCVTQKVMGTSP
jgi:hypothetical protein